MTKPSAPTLTDAKGMGGINASDGFDYQGWDALVRLPGWLRQPAFEGMTLEGLEDVEARFFAPYAPHGHLLDRYQAKSGKLTRGDIGDVLKNFVAFEKAYPGIARTQVIVTPGVPSTLNWIVRDPGRVRRARPFYAPFAGITAASDTKLRADLATEFGSDLGDFFADSVEVAIRSLADRNAALAAFGASLYESFPKLDVGMPKVAAAFTSLLSLASAFRGVMLTRQKLEEVIEQGLGVSLFERALPVHVRADSNGENPNALEIDARKFSGAGEQFPPAAEWESDLMIPVRSMATWARSRNLNRIVVSGSFRLSTGFAIGWNFRAATGFELEVPVRGGQAWSSDHRPENKASPWTIAEPDRAVNGSVVVAVGVLRDPTPDVCNALGVGRNSVLSANLGQPITTGDDAQAFVQAIKECVSRIAERTGAGSVALYLAAPAAFAVMLGHRWNAMLPTQLHEFRASDRTYIATAQIAAKDPGASR